MLGTSNCAKKSRDILTRLNFREMSRIVLGELYFKHWLFKNSDLDNVTAGRVRQDIKEAIRLYQYIGDSFQLDQEDCQEDIAGAIRIAKIKINHYLDGVGRI